MLEQVIQDLLRALNELYEVSKVETGGVLVVGCSTSEVMGRKIGTGGSESVAADLFSTIQNFCLEKGLFIAAQCCEHLNRALVVEKELLLRDKLVRVNAIPHAHAGGSFATAAYQFMKDPVLVSALQADFGIDIGSTLIGMHLKPVVVPVRVSVSRIGDASLVLARTRCPFVGGERALYNPDLG
ncbi:MAG TPA: TIGR01440 family protein [Treponemataceae bacterium]|nr:TIGR01440 family protein [Treponemataceae bacterium]